MTDIHTLHHYIYIITIIIMRPFSQNHHHNQYHFEANIELLNIFWKGVNKLHSICPIFFKYILTNISAFIFPNIFPNIFWRDGSGACRRPMWMSFIRFFWELAFLWNTSWDWMFDGFTIWNVQHANSFLRGHFFLRDRSSGYCEWASSDFSENWHSYKWNISWKINVSQGAEIDGFYHLKFATC